MPEPRPAENPGPDHAELVPDPEWIARVPGPLRGIVALIVATFDRFFADDVPRLAAAMSYYLLLALAPALLMVNAAVGVVSQRIGADVSADKIAEFSAGASASMQQAVSWAGSYAPYVATALVLFGVIGVFGQFIGALEKIWDLPPNRTPARAFLRHHAWSLGLLGVLTLGLLAALVVFGVLAIVASLLLSFAQQLGVAIPEFLLSLFFRGVLIFVVSAVLFSVAFTVSPDRGTRWRDALLGSMVTAVLFTAGDLVLAEYLTTTQRFNVFGAFQFFVVIIVWIYYAALVSLWGAELTRLLILRAERRRAS